jgi:DNA-binding SARP family transcriptional activator/tetratricopeptide (TPR) repeat protein
LGPTGEPVRFRVKKHLALLAYLAVEPTAPHRRDALADFLWPQASASEGRHSLATALSVLRARLGRAAFETTRDTIRLTGVGLELDLTRLAGGDVLGDEVRRPLEVGAFLDGLDIPDADEFLRWKERHQARLLPAILAAMILLIDRCRRTADSRQMERIADRMLALDPLSEDAVRAKMEARAFAGDRVTALRVFEEFRTQLLAELDATPSDRLDRLAVRLRRRGWERTDGPPVAPVPPVATEQWRNRPFIGRANEHRTLYEAWERMQKGEAGHVLVRGDSGIGKTTIVERVTTAAVLEGATSSRVQCYELEREIPYAAVTGLVLGLLDKPGASATLPESLAELARTVPEVRQRFPSIPPAVETHGETARVRLTEAMHDLVFAIGEEHPVILVVDDLHLADDASLAVLHLLLRRAAGQPLMLMLTVRQGELGRSPQALRLLESTGALGFVEVGLTPLADPEASEFLDSLVGADQRRPGAAARRALLAAGAGYPMVLELLLQDWQLNGEQSLALSLGAMTAELHSAEGARAGPYEAVFDRIVRTVDPTTRAVLNLAAVLGHRLNALPMYGIVELGLGQAMHGLSELAKLRVLRDGGQRMEFINELLRACAYRAVPSPVRKQLHSEIADWLLAGKLGGEQAGGLEVAWHCIRAGRQEQAIPYLLSGAREALELGAPHETELSLGTALPALPASAAVEARVLIVEAIQEQGRWDESLEALQPLLSLPSEKARVSVLTAAAAMQQWSISVSEREETRRHMLQIVRASTDPLTRLKAIQVAAQTLNELRDAVAANEVLAEVNNLPLEPYNRQEQIDLGVARAQALFFMGDHPASMAEIERMLALAEQPRIVSSTTLRLCTGAATLLVTLGNYDAAKAQYEECFKLATRIGRQTAAASAAANLALCCFRLGNTVDQLKWAEESLTLSERFGSYVGRLHAWYCRAAALAIREENRAVKNSIVETDSWVTDGMPRWVTECWSLYKADLLALIGARTEALVWARTSVNYTRLGTLAAYYTGAYARWCALCALTPIERRAARQFLGLIYRSTARRDALDQVEILAALIALGEGDVDTELRVDLEERLSALPVGVPRLLKALRLLN